ncbi:MAG: hypothetical protein HYZ75_03015 [Elusimicrobia bacterium]|nr:hypothetical protein [Elusimicrobiota bacterium]
MRIEWKQVVAGLAVGMILGAGMGAWRIRHLHRGLGAEGHQRRMLERFSKRLELTDDQRAKVSTILDNKRRRLAAMRAEAAPKFEELRTSTRGEIRALLTPEQLPAFDKLAAEPEMRRKKRGRP